MSAVEAANLNSVIADTEILIRSVKAKELKKGRPHWRIFRPPVGQPLISVMRGLMGSDFCKTKSKEISAEDYSGMAALTVSEVLETGALVHDDQEGQYPGHAHIDHIDPPVLPNDPNNPIENAKLVNRCKTLAEKLRYYADPAPNDVGWQGKDII